MSIDSIAQLQTTRRYITTTLLNLPIQANETSVGTFLTMLDHFIANPHEYQDLIKCQEHY